MQKRMEAKKRQNKLKYNAEGIADVTRQNVVINAKKNHDMAPNFSLTNATGKEVQLSDYLKRTSCFGIVAVVSLLQYDFALFARAIAKHSVKRS
jgi:hypothetical protein